MQLKTAHLFSEGSFRFCCKEYEATLPIYINFPAVQNRKRSESSLRFLRNEIEKGMKEYDIFKEWGHWSHNETEVDFGKKGARLSCCPIR